MKLPKIILKHLFIFVLSQLLLTVSANAFACSLVFWNNNGVSKVVARSMDLFMDDQPYLVIYPKNTPHVGHAGENSLNWKSKYGSIAITAMNLDAASEGMNDQGLTVSLLYLDKSEYEKRNPKIPGVSNAHWAQYVLDNFKTVQELIDNINKFQIVSFRFMDREWPFHLTVQDASGDSAVFEYIDGKLVIHHSKQYTVVTNEPAYSLQLANLKKYKLFGGTLAMPGDVDPLSRFVRASSYLKMLPKPKDDVQADVYLLGVLRTVMVPYGAEDTSGNETEVAWPTRWAVVKDLTNKIFYFNATSAPNIIWVDMAKLNLNAGAPIMGVNPKDPTLSGDITKDLKVKRVKPGQV